MANLAPVRVALYFCMFLFSCVVLGLSAYRLHYTTHVPPGDPVNGGVDFYDPIVPEILVSSILGLLWSLFGMFSIARSAERPSFVAETVILFVLWVFWLCGAAISTAQWTDLRWCWIYRPCRILTAMMAFTWIGWIFLTFLLISSIALASKGRAWKEPMHGKYYGPNRDSARY